eukprot:2238140-Pleurochrysis_carterae.AAC.1
MRNIDKRVLALPFFASQVEHGFNGGCTLGWFGKKCMALALRAWVRRGLRVHTRSCAFAWLPQMAFTAL